LTEKGLDVAVRVLKYASLEDVYVAVGSGQISGRDVLQVVYPGLPEDPQTMDEHIQARFAAPTEVVTSVSEHSVVIEGLIPGMAIHYAGCCHPLPGDRIVGIVITGKVVTIHTYDCESLVQYHDQPERWIDLDWGTQESKPHIGRMSIVAVNAPGGLANISTVIVKNNANIVNLKIANRTNEFCDMIVDVEVRNGQHLDAVITSLRASPFVTSIERAKH
jgi:GTP pyrophosphokinase